MFQKKEKKRKIIILGFRSCKSARYSSSSARVWLVFGSFGLCSQKKRAKLELNIKLDKNIEPSLNYIIFGS